MENGETKILTFSVNVSVHPSSQPLLRFLRLYSSFNATELTKESSSEDRKILFVAVQFRFNLTFQATQ